MNKYLVIQRLLRALQWPASGEMGEKDTVLTGALQGAGEKY